MERAEETGISWLRRSETTGQRETQNKAVIIVDIIGWASRIITFPLLYRDELKKAGALCFKSNSSQVLRTRTGSRHSPIPPSTAKWTQCHRKHRPGDSHPACPAPGHAAVGPMSSVCFLRSSDEPCRGSVPSASAAQPEALPAPHTDARSRALLLQPGLCLR